MEKIEYQALEYSEANKRLSDKLLNELGTYFLNGKWGSGKSTFLRKLLRLIILHLLNLTYGHKTPEALSLRSYLKNCIRSLIDPYSL